MRVATDDILACLETKKNQSWYQNFGSKDLYVPSLLVTSNSHGKTKIIAILTIPMGKAHDHCAVYNSHGKNQQPEFPFDQGFLTHTCFKYGYIHKYLYDYLF